MRIIKSNPKRSIPTRLHKFRAFSSFTIEMLVEDNLFFADPSTFNDPLDTRPTLDVDLSVADLKEALTKLIKTRVCSEMKDRAKQVKLSGQNTDQRIERLATVEAERRLANTEYNATDSDRRGPSDKAMKLLLGLEIENELLRRYQRGIVSLSERYLSPLLWSHYGDQHRGICVGYSVPEKARSDLYRADYRGGRMVKASEVAAMLSGDIGAARKVDNDVLTRKAPDWAYEREWRLLGKRGLQPSPLELETVTFGMRCSRAVQHTVVAALAEREGSVTFHEIYEVRGSFQLKRRRINLDELRASYPERSQSVSEAFDEIEP